jgi:D-3-phosphoglycerate dehydrogenase / 2-oxoglutarate reductase
MPTVYIPDPVDVLMPFAQERAVAAARGAAVVLGDGASPAIRDAEVILTTWIRFPPEAISAMERCRLIVRYGIGVDTIDLAAATECGIVVANAPTYCVTEVADHAAGLILSFARRIPWLDRQVRSVGWAAAQQGPHGIRRLSALTLGVVGLGKIGRAVARRMAPFGFRILGHDPYLADGQVCELGAEPAALDELLSVADIVSLHVPLAPATRHLVDARRLAMMKPSAAIVNTSRGAVIDEAALVQALQDDRIFGAAIDVVEQEPLAPDHPLLALDPRRVILTPHFAASSEEVIPDLHREVCDAFAAVLDGFWPPSVMNPGVVPKLPLA